MDKVGLLSEDRCRKKFGIWEQDETGRGIVWNGADGVCAMKK